MFTWLARLRLSITGRGGTVSMNEGNWVLWVVFIGAVMLLGTSVGFLGSMAVEWGKREPLPGVYIEVPEGWTLSSSSGEYLAISSDGSPATYLVPDQYRDERDGSSVGAKEAVIQLSRFGSGANCDPQSVQVDELPSSQEIIDTAMQEDSDILASEGYDNPKFAYGSMDNGTVSVSGTNAKWNLSYFSSAYSWLGSDTYASEYPNYDNGVLLAVCIEDLDLEVTYSADAQLLDPENSENEVGPTMESNAFLSEAREQVHADAHERYGDNFQAFINVLESVNTGWFSGGADLEGLPASIEGYEEFLDDPFDGELAAEGVPPGEEPIYEDMTGDAIDDAGLADSPEATMPEETITDSEEGAEVEAFVSEYFDAVDQEDWQATYSMLAEVSQQEFTEEAWIEVQQIRHAQDGAPPPLESVEAVNDEEFTSSATVTFEDGSTTEITILYDPQTGELGRLLSEEDISYLTDLGLSQEASGEEFLVEDAIRRHYEAIGRQDFEEAYSYFGPTFRATNSEEDWIAEEESYDITSSTVYSVDVVSVSGDTAQAAVDVSFEDNTGTSDFYLEWQLVDENGEWKLDETTASE
jgi:hypothetical protein